ncbi:Hypothetical protein SRAE_2000336800 [Strongyloides ratti]|uniref:Uncharacterized protein n=1 Tax=Strongyloides ratti TaxID=34506 RepID=A0A090LKP6_STRRB|nr:Hypothetical protein SRAE_2000336800 [Strongyloides ratti]CEF68713.1 Hypothetical protein SRAE_2000336800 [Strongyloides ratti]
MNTFNTISYYNYRNKFSFDTLSTCDSLCPSICSSCPEVKKFKYKIPEEKDYTIKQSKYNYSNGSTIKMFNQNNQKQFKYENKNDNKTFFGKTCYSDSYKNPGKFVQTILINKNCKTEIINNKKITNNWDIGDKELSRTVYLKPKNKALFLNTKSNMDKKFY